MEEYTHRADKFVFRVRRDLLYSRDEVWIKAEGENARVGLTDFAQREGGDIIYAQAVPKGSRVKRGEPLGSYETIKAVRDIKSPLNGTVVETNPLLESKPEVINRDPYGGGWLAVLKSTSIEGLLSAEEYFKLMKGRIADEMRKLKGL